MKNKSKHLPRSHYTASNCCCYTSLAILWYSLIRCFSYGAHPYHLPLLFAFFAQFWKTLKIFWALMHLYFLKNHNLTHLHIAQRSINPASSHPKVILLGLMAKQMKSWCLFEQVFRSMCGKAVAFYWPMCCLWCLLVIIACLWLSPGTVSLKTFIIIRLNLKTFSSLGLSIWWLCCVKTNYVSASQY